MVSAYLFGDKPAGAVALQHMLDIGWEVKAVVSAMQKREYLSGPSLKSIAAQRGIPYITQKQLLENNPEPVDLVISYMYRNLVKKESLNLAQKAAVNFHAAPLPRFGGWAYYNVAILEEVQQYGVTCHHMDEGFDTGAICMQRFFDIGQSETAVSLEQKAQIEMLLLFAEFVMAVNSGKPLPSTAQDPSQMRYMKKAEFDSLKHIPQDANAETIDRYARAFWYPPFDLAYIEQQGARVEVIPKCAKEDIAKSQHQDDFDSLQSALKEFVDECHSCV